MTGWKRFKEPLKSLLIVLLAASAVFLMMQSGVFTMVLREHGQLVQPNAPADSILSYSAAALPTEAAVTGPSGLCYGLKYDSEALQSLYQELSAYLGEAIGSAAAPVRMSEKSWLKLLKGTSLYLDYDCALPVSALAAWLGVESPWEGSLRTMILSEGEGGSVLLCFRNASGVCWRSETAGSWAGLWERLSTYLPNGASFALGWETLSACDPCMLVLEQLPEMYAISASGAQEAPARRLAEKTGINLSGQSRYSETDGTVVYPGESGVIRLHGDGGLSYSASVGYCLAEAETVPAMVERSRALIEELHDSAAGDERLRFCSDTLSGGSGTVEFNWYCEGVPILSAAGAAARVGWTDGRLTELYLLPRTYRVTAESVELLPEKQAAAAAGSRRKGSEAGLAFYDSGEERLYPFWQVK